jgi:hypothetical protein
MDIEKTPFFTTDWDKVPTTTHPGVKGRAIWRTINIGAIRIRKVEYSPEYIADHWCSRGHILLVLDGELIKNTLCTQSVNYFHELSKIITSIFFRLHPLHYW